MATLLAKETYTDVIQEGNKFVVTTAASSTATVEVWAGYDTLLSSTSIAASTTNVFGQYQQEVRIKISCLTGSLTYTESTFTTQIDQVKTATIASGAAVSETTATPVNVTSLSLEAGDWELSGVVDRTLTGTTATIYGAGISLTTATMPSQAGGSGLGTDAGISQSAAFGATVTGGYSTAIPPVSLSVTATTTIYLVAADTFSAGTVAVYGTLRAKRIR
jgi:hypothetical protein